MYRTSFFLLIVAIGLFSLGFVGCGENKESSTSSGSKQNKNNEENHEGHNHGKHNGQSHGDHDNHAKESDMDKMKKGLADLSAEDRDSAMKQHVCPVSGQMLGTMGKPQKLQVKDQEVWICCDGCKKDLEADPDKYLAKIKK